jgi:hypothetical protein
MRDWLDGFQIGVFLEFKKGLGLIIPVHYTYFLHYSFGLPIGNLIFDEPPNFSVILH